VFCAVVGFGLEIQYVSRPHTAPAGAVPDAVTRVHDPAGTVVAVPFDCEM
jgi:hypothetical protein